MQGSFKNVIINNMIEIVNDNIWYSPKHWEVMKRQRKKRKIDHTSISFLGNEPMDVV